MSDETTASTRYTNLAFPVYGAHPTAGGQRAPQGTLPEIVAGWCASSKEV